ncbi:MAG: CFI-box-CTERM domain-containing protein [Bacillota bacterium]
MKPPKIVLNNRGITLVELIISLALLAVVLGLGYNLYFFTNQAYAKAEARWIAQRSVQAAVDFITRQLRTAYQLQLDPTGEPADGEYSIYLSNGNTGSLLYREGAGDPVTVVDGNLTLTFTIPENEDHKSINNVLSFRIQALDANARPLYAIDSSVTLLNMLEGRGYSTNSSGTVVRYKRTSPEAPIPAPSVGRGSGCFIATAAFGSEFAPAVILLKQFRDEYMLTNPPGRLLVKLYYQYSPEATGYIAGSEPLRALARGLLIPVVGVVFLLLHPWPTVICAVALLLAWALRRDSAKQRNSYSGKQESGKKFPLQRKTNGR